MSSYTEAKWIINRVCQRCGAGVNDTDLHDRFHRQLDDLARAAGMLSPRAADPNAGPKGPDGVKGPVFRMSE